MAMHGKCCGKVKKLPTVGTYGTQNTEIMLERKFCLRPFTSNILIQKGATPVPYTTTLF